MRPMTGMDFLRWLADQGVAVDPNRTQKVTLTATPDSLVHIVIEQLTTALPSAPQLAAAPITIREK